MQYKLYPSLDEESQVSLRSARSGSSVRSESVLSSVKDDETSEPESELQMVSKELTKIELDRLSPVNLF